MTAAAKRSPMEQRMFEEGAADAEGGFDAQPPPNAGPLADAYMAGYESAAGESEEGSSGDAGGRRRRSGSARGSSRSGRSRRTGRSRPRRSSSVGGRAYGRAARQLQAPIEDQLVSGMWLLGMTVALAAAYNALVHSEQAVAFIAAPANALRWLDSNRSIPYGPHR